MLKAKYSDKVLKILKIQPILALTGTFGSGTLCEKKRVFRYNAVLNYERMRVHIFKGGSIRWRAETIGSAIIAVDSAHDRPRS